MKPLLLTFLSLLLAVTSLCAQTSTIAGLTDATTISESDKVWMADISETGSLADRDATLEQIVSPFAADPSTNAYFSAAEWLTDLGIESGADVTDTANVTTAGALMDSEVDSDIQTLALPASTTISTFGATLIDDADQSTARATLGLIIDTDVQSVLAEGAFSDGDKTKLDGIEALADVTDTANVTTAGALMDSEVDADIQTLALPASTTISAFGATLIDDADQSTARATLGANLVRIIVAFSDEYTGLIAGTSKVTFRAPFAFTLTDVRASLGTAPTGANLVVDLNESGSSVLSTKLSIDATELTSTTAATPAVISDSAIADDAELTIDIDQIGSTIAGAGGKLTIYGTY